MRKINKLGKRAAAMALAISLTLSTAAPVLAVDADEVQTPAAQTEQQEEAKESASSEEEQPTEEPADSDKGVELPADSEERKPVVVLPGQLPAVDADSKEEPASLDEALAAMDGNDSMIATYSCHYNTSNTNTDVVYWVKKPTCTEDGEAVLQCTDYIKVLGKRTRCPNVAKHTIPKFGHSYVHKNIPVTCETDGKSWDECTRCGDKINVVVTPATGHTAAGEAVGHKDPTCEEAGYDEYVCATCGKTYQVAIDKLGHDWDEGTVEQEYPCVEGVKTYTCQREGCDATKTETVAPTAEHTWGEWVVTKEATCYAEGERQHTCTVCGEVETEAVEKIDHTWGEWVNDNKPACQQQTATRRCTVDGCGATESKNLSNLGSDGNPLPHKHSTYVTVYDKWTGVIPTGFTSTCDYCGGDFKEYSVDDSDALADAGAKAALRNVKLDGKSADEYVDAVINKALANAQTAVKNAKTKEEALDALDQISITVKSELSGIKISVGDLGTEVTISEEDLNDALKSLDDTVADLKDSLNDSFLSQETVTNVVDKLAGDVQDSNAPQAGVKKILRNTIYGAITGKDTNTDNTQAINSMVLQLVQDVVKSNEGWDDLTDSLVDDALDLAVDELMKDETYAKLLQTKLGADTLDEVRAEIKKQLAEDPTFMNSVRDIANKAASNAQKRVDGGWPEDKVMEGLQEDLLPDVADLVSNQIDKLGAGASEIVDNKVSDTVHKFLPGKLGDWVSDKIGGKVGDAVTGKVNGLNKDVTDLITNSIRQLTCTHEWGARETLKAATCTEKGQTGVVCHKCGKIKDKKDDIPATGHTPVTDPAVAPTETTDGLTEGSHCSTCGAVLQAQEVVPMLDPTIDTWFSRAATTEADAKAAGFDSVDAANAALDAALTAAGFDPANAEHFTVQVNSSIGVLPNDRFPESGVTGKLTLPEGTRGKTAQTYYAVQMFTADTRFHKAGDVVVTPVSIDAYAKTGLQFTVYSEAVMAIAWKAQ